MRTITCLCLIITQQQRKNTHVAAHYVFMPWQKIVCETQHKLHIHIGKMALSPPIQRVLKHELLNDLRMNKASV